MADFIFKKHTKKKCQIRLPTNCKTCQMEKTGQCSSCAIVELKQQVREKDKQLITAKCYRTRSETHLKCLKLKLKENRKKLNTCRQKLLRMKRYIDNDSHVYISNCYETVMSEICKLKLLNVFCFEHEESLPYIILQYVHIRFHTESKRFRNFYLSKERTQMKTNKKMSRTSIHAKNTLPKPEVNINTKV
ncbi:hypothetical protein OUZ56_008025 [Daphnia magna]|nr:hypothetical protein OUZ56_008025 [Daphnia magna]